jgi:hypothetical protein
VQGWVNGSIANDGILLKETTENQNWSAPASVDT